MAPVENETYWYCTKKKGFIPTLIQDVITRRIRIKEIMKEETSEFLEGRQNSLKVLANAIYGYFGFPMARWYSLESARATTAFGRHYIKKVISTAQSAGFHVIYSDTDSVFLTLDKRTKGEAKNFVDNINLELPGLMELEYEGFYPRGIFVSAKAGSAGAKKKYALLTEKGTVKVTGFEIVRRNWSEIAKEVQQRVLSIILKENNKEKALRYAKQIITELRDNKVKKGKLIIITQLQKELSTYDSIGPHVKIAQDMKERNIDVGPGSIIRYIITKGGGKIRDRARLPDEVKEDDYDGEYYINNQVVPSIEKIFEIIGFTKDDILARKEQAKLASFF